MSAQSRVALVTGAGTGIGRAVSAALHGDGYSVALAGRRRKPLEDTRAQLLSANESAKAESVIVQPTDVADPAAVALLFAALKSAFGRLDVLFNNAGIGARPASLEELAPDEWRAVVDVNLNGVVYCCQEAIRLMKAQHPKGGRIINNGSISATTPRPLSAAYTATKHAVSGLTKSIALDGRGHAIACSQIDIGNAATDMTEQMAAGALQPDGSKRPEPRMDVDHIGSAVLYMANLPLESNVLFMTIKATEMPYEGRG